MATATSTELEKRSPFEATPEKPARPPPRVPGLPVLGSALRYLKSPIGFFIDAATALGPVFSFGGLGNEATVISGQLGIDLIKAHGDGVIDRVGQFDAFTEECSFDIFEAMGEKHTRLKSLVRLGFSRQIISQFTDETVDEVAGVADAWREGERVRLLDAVADASMHSVMKALTPADLSAHARDFVKLGVSVMLPTVKLRPPAILWSPAHIARRKRIWRVVDETIARHKAGEFDEEARMSMVDAFLGAETKSGEKLSDTDVRGATIYAMFGTHIYVGRVVAFMLMEILKNPALYARVQEEVDAAFSPGNLDPSLFRRMWNLRAVYQESMRVYPLLAGLPFRASKDLVVGGYSIPKGRMIIVSVIPGHYMSEGYDNPLAFDASRCLAPRKEHRCPGAWAPYGVSPRMCVAAGMTEALAMTLVATLLHRRSLSLTRPTYQPRLRMYPLIAPADHLPVIVGPARTDADRTATVELLLERDDKANELEEEWQTLTLPPLVPQVFAPGEDAVTQGEHADAFYIILDGEAVVLQDRDGDEVELRRLGSGDSFGERGLLKGVPRTATVRAGTELRVLSLDRDTFLELAVSADLLGKDLGRAIQQRYVKAAMVEAMPRLGAAKIAESLDEFELAHVSAGDEVFHQGDVSDSVYVITSGQVEIVVDTPTGERVIRTMGPGEFFGEIGVLQERRRTSTVRATEDEDLVLLTLDREAFQALVKDAPSAYREDVMLLMGQRLMRSVDIMDEATRGEDD
jgi:CRP-like cAMP-binding protein/cytochrome P450